jgi:DNA-binding MarR family transcriptional regulator
VPEEAVLAREADLLQETSPRCSEVLVAIRRIIRAIDIHSRYLVQQSGLTGPQLVLLQEIAARKEMVIGELARRASLSPATVTSILDRLEKRGLVERERSQEDKRHVWVTATREGLELLLEAPPLLQQRFVSEFEGLEEWEQTLILSSLQRIAAMMDAGHIDAAPMLASASLHVGEGDSAAPGKVPPAKRKKPSSRSGAERKPSSTTASRRERARRTRSAS